jgi:RNA polymerase sigma factor (sigma-70 family)
MYRAVLNEARMKRRADDRRLRREQRSWSEEPIVPDTDVEILGPILALSMRQRAVIVLTYWQDMNQASIGALLGISRGAVARHLTRAHERLRELISND